MTTVIQSLERGIMQPCERCGASPQSHVCSALCEDCEAHDLDAAVEPGLRTLLSSGLRVLRERDGLALSEEQIRERVNNLLAALLGNYRVTPLAEDGP